MTNRSSHTDGLNPLFECSASLLSLMAPFSNATRGQDLDSAYRDRILSAFDEMDRLAFEHQIDTRTLADARYALAAFADETVLSSSWPGKRAWMEAPLQLEMFGDHLAGEGFFERLSRIRQGGPSQTPLLELYALCLQLGFEGMYRLNGSGQLSSLHAELRHQINAFHRDDSIAAALQGVPEVSLVQRVKRETPSWVITVVTVAIIFFTYLGYTLAVGKVMSASVTEIQQQDRVLKALPPVETLEAVRPRIES